MAVKALLRLGFSLNCLHIIKKDKLNDILYGRWRKVNPD